MAAFAAMNDLDALTPMIEANSSLKGAQLIDVRNADEIERQPLDGVIHIPIDELRSRINELDAKKETVVVCQSGLRAHTATRILKQHGFDDISTLSGAMTVRELS